MLGGVHNVTDKFNKGAVIQIVDTAKDEICFRVNQFSFSELKQIIQKDTDKHHYCD